MKIIYINKCEFEPELISEINTKEDVVISTLENNNIFNDDNYRLFLTNKTDIMLQNQKLIGNILYKFDYNLNTKWSIPKGIDLSFTVPTINSRDYINTFYVDNIWCDESPKNNYFMSFKICFHIDKERTQSSTKIMAGSKLVQIDFGRTLFNSIDYIENIYVIENNYIYEEFVNHFYRE